MRVNPSAMPTPTRSCRHSTDRIPAAAVASMTGVVGYALRKSTPSRLRISATASTIFMTFSSDSEQAFEVLPENGFLLVLREALHAEDPRDRPVQRHVVRPVRSEDDAIDAHAVDEIAQGALVVHDAVVVEPRKIGARRLGDVHARLGAHLPGVVHAADPVAGVAAAVAE